MSFFNTRLIDGYCRTSSIARRCRSDRHEAIDDDIGRSMPKLSKGIFARGIFGGIALSLTLGAVQFASGRDLTAVPLDWAMSAAPTTINRAAKADRFRIAAKSAGQTQTIALRLDGLPDTSVLVRLPVERDARSLSPAPLISKPSRPTLACEPMVSVLTDIAKQLQPGRCVT
jgi:hypothetical protein